MPILSDFGDARIGEVHNGLIQPDIYRAPEVMLGMSWTAKVDIWNVGVLVRHRTQPTCPSRRGLTEYPKIWDLFEDHHLFDGRGSDGRHSDAQILAEMIALLGPPPAKFLRKSSLSQKYWDASDDITLPKGLVSILRLISLGRWKASEEVPQSSLEDPEEYLEGANQRMFMQFVRKMLRWDPDERQSAPEHLTNPWLINE